MAQKGGIALILLVLVLIVGLFIGVYLISQNTSWFSNAGSAQMTIPYPSPSATAATADESKETYDNPFVDAEAYENPFNEL
jgi:hypothetical protein